MKKFIVAVLAIMLALPVSNTFAGDPGSEQVAAFIDSITLGIYVDTSYQYVFDKEDGADIDDGSRPLYQENNSFSINAFTISLDKTPTMEGGIMDLFGFRTDILFGQQADLLSSAGFGDDVDNVDAYQAYLQFLVPVGESGILVQAGKFVTLAGFEVIEAKDNPNITRSWLFGNAIPFTHTGVRASTSFGAVDVALGLNNGWDVTDDNNEAKTVEAQVALNFESGMVSDGWLGVTGYFGKEDDEGDDTRSLITVVATATFMERFTLIGDLDFGWDEALGDDASWWGAAGYIVAELTPGISGALRVEYFDDPDGFRLGGGDISMFAITPTLIFKPFQGIVSPHQYLENLELRLEYRMDSSSEDYFVDENGELTDTQHGLAAQLLYWIEI